MFFFIRKAVAHCPEFPAAIDDPKVQRGPFIPKSPPSWKDTLCRNPLEHGAWNTNIKHTTQTNRPFSTPAFATSASSVFSASPLNNTVPTYGGGDCYHKIHTCTRVAHAERSFATSAAAVFSASPLNNTVPTYGGGDCDHKMHTCTRVVRPMLNDVRYMFPTTLTDVDVMCKMWSRFVDCVRRYMSSCSTEDQRSKFNKAVSHSMDTVHAICSSDRHQKGNMNG
ncbi:hypothetical protein JTE90_029109 [Oedothorax gibbosus]|uniref:Uncharacterized protein n=1 Tax=Oedothorax gibbosus TaxID=931172 RepID=A0AAV6V8W0_9ARAC|nr:hypothetical protein JTE90_029109 [Oedothorax gibbosus]